MNSLNIKNPIIHLNNRFEECLVIKFFYIDEERQFYLVSDSLSQKGKNHRTFKKLTFLNVKEFNRVLEVNNSNAKNYFAKNSQRTHVIQSMKTKKSSNHFFIDIWFDSYLGGVTFHFDTLNEATIDSKAIIGLGGGYIYYDTETNKEFDFYNPFGVD